MLPFNPEFSLESEQVGAGRTLQAYEGEVSQEVEWAGQRGLRRAVAREDVARADALVRDAERVTLQAAAEAFYRAAAAQRQLDVATEVMELNLRLMDAAQRMREAGEVSRLEENLARVESGRAQARVMELRREAESAFLELRRILALPDDAALAVRVGASPPEPEGLDADSLTRVALERRPDLAGVAAEVEMNRSLLRLVNREALPNLRLSIPFDRLEGPGSEKIGVGVGLSIPLWNRNQGEADAVRAEVDRARRNREALEWRIRVEVLDALQRYRSATQEERMARRTVLEPVEESHPMLEEAYRAGKMDLPTVLLTRNALLDAELDYWNSWMERRLEWTRLQATVSAGLSQR